MTKNQPTPALKECTPVRHVGVIKSTINVRSGRTHPPSAGKAPLNNDRREESGGIRRPDSLEEHTAPPQEYVQTEPPASEGPQPPELSPLHTYAGWVARGHGDEDRNKVFPTAHCNFRP